MCLSDSKTQGLSIEPGANLKALNCLFRSHYMNEVVLGTQNHRSSSFLFLSARLVNELCSQWLWSRRNWDYSKGNEVKGAFIYIAQSSAHFQKYLKKFNKRPISNSLVNMISCSLVNSGRSFACISLMELIKLYLLFPVFA